MQLCESGTGLDSSSNVAPKLVDSVSPVSTHGLLCDDLPESKEQRAGRIMAEAEVEAEA